MEKEIIIQILVADILPNQLLNGLNGVGLTDNDRYTLELDILVAEKMGITKGHIPDSWFSIYHGVMLNIKHTTNPKQEAERMYALLLKHSQG
jgi:hypothetical protein